MENSLPYSTGRMYFVRPFSVRDIENILFSHGGEYSPIAISVKVNSALGMENSLLIVPAEVIALDPLAQTLSKKLKLQKVIFGTIDFGQQLYLSHVQNTTSVCES